MGRLDGSVVLVGGGDVDDVAYCAVFRAAEAAGYLTGQVLHPSDGWVMARARSCVCYERRSFRP
jgi:hypothetical protein